MPHALPEDLKVACMSDQKMRQMFDIFDSDGSGAIETKELGAVMQCLGFGQLPADDLDAIIKEYDADGSGMMEFDEFRLLIKEHTVERGSAEDVFAAFKIFAGMTKKGDRRRNYIRADALERVAKDIGEWPDTTSEMEEDLKQVEYRREKLRAKFQQIFDLAPADGRPEGHKPGLSLVQWAKIVGKHDDKHHKDGEKEQKLNAFGFDAKAEYEDDPEESVHH